MQITIPEPSQTKANRSYCCIRCNKILRDTRGHTFQVKTESPLSTFSIIKCTTCALLHVPMLKRSLITSLIVGSLLTALNQGDLILSGQMTSTFLWKIPSTYLVPFVVATVSGLLNTRR